jgi:flavin-dependent dehydrogenase
MLDKLRASPFVKKYSVQFVNQRGVLSEPFYFMDNKPHECSQTWQVLRSEFDRMLLENAREHGVIAHEGARVLEVLFEGQRAVGVRVHVEGREEQREDLGFSILDFGFGEPQRQAKIQNPKSKIQNREVRAPVVIDASGQSSLIMSRLGLREWDPVLKKAALWTYWKGAYRDSGRDEGATVVIQTEGKNGWFWYIPMPGNVVSVGVVAAYDYLFKDRGTRDYETIYFEEVARCPGVERRITGAQRADEFHAAKEYSYRSKQAAGDGWVLVGDAFGFLDPLYSSGVLLALKSGSLAADAVCEGLVRGDTSAAQLGKWEAEFTKGMDRMRRLVCEYYDGFSFGRFVREYPHLKGHITDLLIGDLFRDEVDDVVEPMERIKQSSASETD